MKPLFDQPRPTLKSSSSRFALVFSLIGLQILACSGEYGSQGITIGALLPTTGELAHISDNCLHGLTVAMEIANSSGGIDGEPIALAIEDTRSSPKGAIDALLAMADKHTFSAAVGPVLSAEAMALEGYAQTRQVLFVSPTASSPDLSGAGGFLFRIWPPESHESEFAAEWVHDHGFSVSRAISSHHHAYEQRMVDAFASRLEQLQGVIVQESEYADLVFLVSPCLEVAEVLREFASEADDQVILLSSLASCPTAIDLASSIFSRVELITVASPEPGQMSPEQLEFEEQFSSRYSSSPDIFAKHCYDATLVIIETMRQGARSAEDIRRHLQAERAFNGATGSIVFGPDGVNADKSRYGVERVLAQRAKQ